MRYLLLCLSFVIFGCSNQADLKADLQQSVSEATQENEPVFSAGYADLNGDGLEDAVVFLKGMQWCGSGGCTLMIFENLGDSYKLVSKSSVTNTPISVAKTETNGWKDVIVWSRGSGFVLMKFNGQQYPHNPSLEAVVSEPQMLEARLVLE
ncbi:hypothetical protein PVK62_00495 [Aliivibrio sp. S3MY1]|uniref:hypothetical protein n=1 Tax=unclassified Aliivibrio TaxID=2645654 RepID=UPI0023798D5E|nr:MULTISPECIES: hypothetical protein [unclassified Aliivibrio]MDD9194313.1 hypothetical protein [Aliivibrio sp. S3MY1]MDD9197980.1 hypothetical protein [Aliivibrio sp. S2MY1]